MAKVTGESLRLFELNGGQAWRQNEAEAVIGPAYPEMGGSVAKFRRVAAKAGSIAAMVEIEAVPETGRTYFVYQGKIVAVGTYDALTHTPGRHTLSSERRLST